MKNTTIPTVHVASPEFQAWMAACQDMIDRDRAQHFPSLEREVLHFEDGQKFIRVVRRNSVFAFIAKVDNNTKALGTVTAGDVLMPASFKVPAKHARGNLFDAHKGMGSMGPYGPAYLR